MSLAGWVKEVCGAVVYDSVCHELEGLQRSYSVSGTTQLMVYAGLESQLHFQLLEEEAQGGSCISGTAGR